MCSGFHTFHCFISPTRFAALGLGLGHGIISFVIVETEIPELNHATTWTHHEFGKVIPANEDIHFVSGLRVNFLYFSYFAAGDIRGILRLKHRESSAR